MQIVANTKGGSRPKGSTSRTLEETEQMFLEHGLILDPNQEINGSRKLLAYTEEGFKVEAKAYRVEQGIIPYVIGKNNPYTIWNIKNIWLPLNAPDYELIDDVYENNKKEMTWRLRNSTLPPFKMNFNNFSNLKRHPIIGKMILVRKQSTSEVLELIETRMSSDWRKMELTLAIESDYEYIDGDDFIFFKDKEGYIYCQNVQAIRNGYSPRKYSSRFEIVSNYNLKHWNDNFNKNEKLLEFVYKGDGKYKFYCEKHGEIEKFLYDAFNGVKCRKCVSFEKSGKAHPRWNDSYTEEERDDKRRSSSYRIWRNAVYERDNHRCVRCGSTDNIVAHHKDGFGWCIERRVDESNGVTLCKECHWTSEDSFHKLYGNGNNTEQQFNEWIEKTGRVSYV